MGSSVTESESYIDQAFIGRELSSQQAEIIFQVCSALSPKVNAGFYNGVPQHISKHWHGLHPWAKKKWSAGGEVDGRDPDAAANPSGVFDCSATLKMARQTHISQNRVRYYCQRETELYASTSCLRIICIRLRVTEKTCNVLLLWQEQPVRKMLNLRASKRISYTA
eukprot:4312061-Pyramimonas_sp.AAC.1